MASTGPKYGRVYHRIWSSTWFREADSDTRLAALYLLTCPHGNTEGLFRLPVLFAQYELGWEPARVVAALDELAEVGFIQTKCGPALRQQPGPCPTPDRTGVEMPNDTATHPRPARPHQRADEPTPIADLLGDLLDDLEARYLANEHEVN